jgi:hypothetical protein
MTASERRRLLKRLEEFANLGDQESEFERFFQCCPEFSPDSSVTWQELCACRDLLREAWAYGSDTAAATLLGLRSLDGEVSFHRISIDWSAGRFEYHPDTQFRLAFYLLFRQSWRAKRCPQCGRYFVADKPPQRYCSFRCYDAAKQQRDLNYWRTVGVRRRQQRLRKIANSTGGRDES